MKRVVFFLITEKKTPSKTKGNKRNRNEGKTLYTCTKYRKEKKIDRILGFFWANYGILGKKVYRVFFLALPTWGVDSTKNM